MNNDFMNKNSSLEKNKRVFLQPCIKLPLNKVQFYNNWILHQQLNNHNVLLSAIVVHSIEFEK